MELPRRQPQDVFLPDGALAGRLDALRCARGPSDWRIGIVYAFDFRTRMLPYWYADKRMAPAAVRALGDVLHAAGFTNVRIVLQQWTPNFRPSAAELNGRPLDVLLVSAMQVHAEPAYDLIRDAHTLGDARPWIVAGGPKATYEPTDYLELGPRPGVGADCVVTGEAYVLLDLLHAVIGHHAPGESARTAFERARRNGALDSVPGLVYLHPEAPPDRLVAVNTGVQRLLRDLDELPLPDAGYRMLEPHHRGRGLRLQPLRVRDIARKSPIASVVATQGCKFNCSFCPIPSLNQRAWRHKSPARFADEIRHIHRAFGIGAFFGTDDNFFNNRRTVQSLMGELARTSFQGVSLGRRIRFFTEATQFDVYKNRDLLPLCHDAGMRAIWFGIEDISASLINKGQNAGKTADLFAEMIRVGIHPMAMMIHSDDQPLRSPDGDLSGLLNQARYLFKQGAMSYQCTYLGPAVGSRDFETAAQARRIYRRVGGKLVPQAFQDGNHVVASLHPRPWTKQWNLLRAYAAFYNPINTLRLLAAWRREPSAGKRLVFQLVGQVGLALTIPRSLAWAWKLWRGPIEVLDGLEAARIPMIDAATGREINWGIENMPSLEAGFSATLPANTLPGRCPGEPRPINVTLPVMT